MAKIRMIDDAAAVVLLAGIFRQCRKDIVRRAVPAEHRVSAIEVFLDMEGVNDAANEGFSVSSGDEIRAASGRRNKGAAAARGSTPAGAVGTRFVRRC